MNGEREPGNVAEGGPDSSAASGSATPAHMYVNYLFADHSAPRHAYLFQLAGQDMQSAVENAVAEIIGGKQPVEGSPGQVVWKHRSYIVFVLNDPSQRLTGVDFLHRDTSANHTFSGEKFLDDFGPHTAIYYLNERKNKHGEPLKEREAELYRWKAHHKRRQKSLDADEDKPLRPVTHENSGTNLGP